MPLIEGIGDEVTLSAVVLTFVLTLVLAWWTTFVGDRPLHVHIIRPQSTRHQQRSNRIQNQRTQPEETPQVVSPADVSNRTNESSRESEHETAGNSTDAGNDDEEEEGEGSVLRQRRTGSEGSREVLQNVANIENSEADASTVGNTETSEVTEPTMRQRKRCMDSINIENLQMAKHNDHEESNSSDVHEDGYLQSNVREDRTVGAVVTEQEQVERETENGTSVLQAACETTPEMSERFASSETVQERSKAVAKTETGQERPQCETDRISSEEAGRNDAEQVESDAAQSESVDRSDIPDGHITIRLKFLSENERSVTAGLQITLGQFRRETFVQEIEAARTVKFIYNGHLLRDDNQTLSEYGLTHNCVLHCHVTQAASQPMEETDNANIDIDLGRFMVPLFGFILMSVWYLRWQYRYMFNSSSTIALIAVSLLFVLAVLAAWRS